MMVRGSIDPEVLFVAQHGRAPRNAVELGKFMAEFRRNQDARLAKGLAECEKAVELATRQPRAARRQDSLNAEERRAVDAIVGRANARHADDDEGEIQRLVYFGKDYARTLRGEKPKPEAGEDRFARIANDMFGKRPGNLSASERETVRAVVEMADYANTRRR